MSTYAIGDVQGCYDQLMALLEEISFNPNNDTLWFAGDLVNRGPKSLETLHFISSLPNVVAVLGNHDLHLLALANGKKFQHYGSDTILRAPDKDELLFWLRQCPLIHIENNYVMTHAGLYPFWTVNEAQAYADEIHTLLKSDSYRELLDTMYGDSPERWDTSLTSWERYRFIINAFTRMRFCSTDGALELKTKGAPEKEPKGFIPWFNIPNKHPDAKILFGHWAALEGTADNPNVFALDTGCVWGGTLSAVRLEDEKWFHVPGIPK